MRLIFQHWILFSYRFGKSNLGQGNELGEDFSQRLINETEDRLRRDLRFKPNLCDSLDKGAGRNLNGQLHNASCNRSVLGSQSNTPVSATAVSRWRRSLSAN